jgi:rhomboid protease GluP
VSISLPPVAGSDDRIEVNADLTDPLARLPRIWQTAPATLLLLVTLILVHLVVELSGGSQSSWTLLRCGGNFKQATLHGEPWRLLTSIFLHGGVLHLAVNGYALYSLGRLVERLYGMLRFFSIYLLAGISGSAASAVLGEASRLSVGASGAIFGLLGATLVVMLWLRGLFPEGWRKQVIINLLVVLGLNLYIGYSLSMVDNAAHLGGLVGGALAGFFFVPGPRALTISRLPWLVKGVAGTLLVVSLLAAVMVLVTSPAQTLARLPRHLVRRGGLAVECPEHWILAKRPSLELREPLVKLLIAEFAAIPLEPEENLEQVQEQLAQQQIQEMKQQPEISGLVRRSSTTLSLVPQEASQLELQFSLLGQVYRQVIVFRRQGDFLLMIKLLIPVIYQEAYKEIFVHLVQSVHRG